MKKVSTLCLTAFYLLLTTGMFVCIVHCTIEHLVGKINNNSSNKLANEHDDNKCKGDKDCDCCKKHDNFVIKENIKPGFSSQIAGNTTLIYPKINFDVILPITKTNVISWPDCHAPPEKSGKSISIELCSLQI